MTRLKLVIVAGFMIMFVAGVAVGLRPPLACLATLGRPDPAVAPTTRPDDSAPHGSGTPVPVATATTKPDSSPHGSHPPFPPGGHPTTRSDDSRPHGMGPDLHLTPVQDKQIKEIWKEARVQAEALSQTMYQKSRELDRVRDDAISDLLTTEQRSTYKQICSDHDKKVSDLRIQIHEVMQKAEASTREILTPEQRIGFDDLVKHRHGPGMSGSPNPGMHRHGSWSGPRTNPSDGPETAPSR